MRVLYFLRDLRSKKLFEALRKYCRGEVIDIGGADFFSAVKNDPKINFTKWTCLENNATEASDMVDPRFVNVIGDGCKTNFQDNSYDTLVNIQVLEHVMEPLKMVQECHRILKPNGLGVFLIPQTSALHFLPHHYYNLTRYWIESAMQKSGFEIIDLKPLGGFWSSTGSHLFYFFIKVFKVKGYTGKEERTLLYFILLPFMMAFALIAIPFCLIFSLGDLNEEPNNHLVVVKKIPQA